jgi:hypothetical protein
MRSLLLDVDRRFDRYRVRLISPLTLVLSDQSIEIGSSCLDTGSRIAMIAPIAVLDQYPQMERGQRKHVEGYAGKVNSRVFQGQLQLHHPEWVLPIDVHFVKNETDWWIGLPVLRHFDLLLREGLPGNRPSLVGPDVLLPPFPLGTARQPDPRWQQFSPY